MTALGIAIRWAHLAACVLVVGVVTAQLLAGRPRTPTARGWEARATGWARWALLAAVLTGAGSLAYQAALVEGRPDAAADAAALLRVLLETQGGHVWLARHGLLLLLGALVAARLHLRTPADWIAARGEGALLAAGSLALLALAGHAAAVEWAPVFTALMDALHLVATGAWLGALLPLAALLKATSSEAGADARPWAVVAARRFSRLALAAVLALALSGAVNTLAHVETVAGLVGTRYGHLLLVKLALIAPILLIAAVNRRTLLPALAGDGPTVGRPAMRRLSRFIAAEAGLGLAVLAVVAALGVSPPARHEQPHWPFDVRLTLDVIRDAPDLRTRALIGSQVAVLGVVGLVASAVTASRRLIVLPAAAGLLAAGGALALPALSVDAYPTTYYRPTVPYHATSIAEGERAYAALCVACHGPHGAGDGAAAASLPVRPADLRAPHTGQHTAGDLYWWITHGIPRSGMPGFAGQLSEEERWDAVNFVRVLGAAQSALALGPGVDGTPPSIVAPDFTFGMGPLPARSLRDYRGQRLVLVVLYELPASRARLTQLARAYDILTPLGVEVIAVPRDGSPDALRQLGSEPPVLFQVVTEGARDIVAAYGRFARTPHAEFLVDRQGYLRTRWGARGTPERDVELLIADASRLNAEPATAPPADVHVH